MASLGICWFGIVNSLAPPKVLPFLTNPGFVLFIGNQWGDIAFDAVTTAVGAGVGRGTGLYKGQTLVTNSIPQKVARVIPDGIKTSMLGAPNQSDVFVTAAKYMFLFHVDRFA